MCVLIFTSDEGSTGPKWFVLNCYCNSYFTHSISTSPLPPAHLHHPRTHPPSGHPIHKGGGVGLPGCRPHSSHADPPYRASGRRPGLPDRPGGDRHLLRNPLRADEVSRTRGARTHHLAGLLCLAQRDADENI